MNSESEVPSSPSSSDSSSTVKKTKNNREISQLNSKHLNITLAQIKL